MRYADSHKAGSRSRILKAAAQQLRARGLHKVSVADVMSDAGLTHGAFYAHFGSKDALVAGVVPEMFGYAGDRACHLPALAADISRADARIRDNFIVGLNRMRGRIADALSRMPRTYPDTDARILVAQIVGAVSLARALGPGAPSDAILRDCLDASIERLGL